MDKRTPKRIAAQLTAALITAAMLTGCDKTSQAAPTTETNTVESSAPSRQLREGVETMLFVFLDERNDAADSGSFRNPSQANLMMLMVVDTQRQKTTALQLNPDTWISFTPPGSSEKLEIPLGMVYSYGSGGSDSCLSGMKAVSELLGGVPIDHYMTFTDDAIAVVNDMVGGVTVTVTEPFPEEYPNLVQGETVTLMGQDAVAYFRYRESGDIENEAHMDRQRQYMVGLFPAFMENAAQEDFLTKVTLQAGEGLSTDLTLSQMVETLELLGKYELEKTVITIPGKAEKVEELYGFRVDKDKMDKVLEELFFS